MTIISIKPLAVVLACSAVLLSACGDSSVTTAAIASVPTPGVALVPGTGVPIAATTSISGAISFIGTVVAGGENSEEIELGDALLATSDADEPDPSV
jgi:hypothetical protein